jgi:cysteine desulfurase
MSDRPSIYLDHAAATPVSPTVAAAMQPYLDQQFYNPSATYLAARKVHDALETARAGVAHWLGTRPSEIIFTAGGTEANNLAIHGIMRQYPDANVVVSAIEHDAVLVPARRYDCHEVAVSPQGTILTQSLLQQIDDQTVLVSVMYANNEIGTLQPLREVAQMVANVRAGRQAAGNSLPLYFHSDACQAGNYLDLHVSRLGVDLLTINGGKIYGPKQSGALYVKGGLQLLPLIDGGGQERGLRSGTENIAQAVGLAAALDEVQPQRHDEAKRLQALQAYFAKQLTMLVPEAILTGSIKHRLPNNIHLIIPGFDNERLLIQLDEQGVMAAAGSACSASSDEPSHVLRAIGMSDADAQSSLRFTMGQTTTEADIDYTLKTLAVITQR